MKIALIAGEASGDLLAADLMAALKTKRADIEFIGMGGPLMQAQGLESWFDYKTLSVMGFIEVMKRLPALLRLRKGLMQRLIQAQPDVVIGIDAPDFNLGLEKLCKKAGLRTIHFVSPSVWAWRKDRARKIGESCDLVLCLFPMEPAIYQEFGIPARYVGHPLADSIPIKPDGEAARLRLGVMESQNLAILPGSRLSEVDKLLPDFLDAAALLQLKIPQPPIADSCRQCCLPGINRTSRQCPSIEKYRTFLTGSPMMPCWPVMRFYWLLARRLWKACYVNGRWLPPIKWRHSPIEWSNASI